MDDCAAAIGGADVTDVGLAEFAGSESCQQRGEYDGEIAFSPVGLASRAVVLRDGLQQGLDGGAGERFGQCLGQLGSAD